jgi:hypothetical protein
MQKIQNKILKVDYLATILYEDDVTTLYYKLNSYIETYIETCPEHNFYINNNYFIYDTAENNNITIKTIPYNSDNTHINEEITKLHTIITEVYNKFIYDYSTPDQESNLQNLRLSCNYFYNCPSETRYSCDLVATFLVPSDPLKTFNIRPIIRKIY